MEMVKVKNVWKKVGEKQVLKNVNFSVKKSEIFGIFGPTGSGKTTLLRIVAGLEKQDKGDVYIVGKIVASKKVFVPPEKRNISFIFQSTALWPHLNVLQHLKLAASNEMLLKEVIDMLDLKRILHLKPSQLSGGQKQRVEIARALVKDSDLILMDEPLNSLDIESKKKILKIFKKIQAKGKTILYVSHSPIEMAYLCKKIGILKDGRIFVTNKSYLARKIKAFFKV